jgi:hypothetical protein
MELLRISGDSMYEEDTSVAPETSVSGHSGGSNLFRNVALGVAVLYVAVSLYFMLEMRGRIDKLEGDQKAAAESVASHNAANM